MIVAIDGPAGSGKSSTARAVAQRLGYQYLDTGAMYRAVALYFIRAACPVTEAVAQELLPGLQLDLGVEVGAQRIRCNGEDLTELIRTPDVSMMASRVSALPAVRVKMAEEQRRLARLAAEAGMGIVLEGRDIGTVVFPDADVKVFMEADPLVRARRRQAELIKKGAPAPLTAVQDEMAARDQRDRARKASPLRIATDAHRIDTSSMTFDEQVEAVVRLVTERSG